jgi:hypothetical protein
VAAQTEQLLWLAYRLQLQPLVQHMHNFIQNASFFTGSVLRDVHDAVFTARVLEAAGVASLPDGKQMLINSVLEELITLVDSIAAGQAHLRPTSLTQQQRQPLKFDAVVNCSRLCSRADTTVAVELDLFGNSTIRVGANRFSVQLRIGPGVATLVP